VKPNSMSTASAAGTVNENETAKALLESAMLSGSLEQWSEAIEGLHAFFRVQRLPGYQTIARLDRFIQRAMEHWERPARQCRIAVLGNSTLALHIPALRVLCFRDQVRTEIHAGNFGSITQEILDPSSGVYSFRPDIVVLAATHHDLGLGACTPDPEAFAEVFALSQIRLWEALQGQLRCHIVQHAFDVPHWDAWEDIGRPDPRSRIAIIHRINSLLRERAPSYVSIADTDGVQAKVGEAFWQSADEWLRFRQHPSSKALPLLADLESAHVRATLGLSKKLLVADLDNTLWGGVVGEDGPAGLRVGPGTPEGEAHAALQDYLLDLRARGILLAICSKNNESDAKEAFLKTPGMRLTLDHFAAFRANWQDKAENIRGIAAELRLGLDSIVFLDDSPVERAWVRQQLPEVSVVPLGAAVSGFVADLACPRYFFTHTISAEDLDRAEQYHQEAARQRLQSTASDLDEFIRSLEVRCAAEPIDDRNLPRAVQLINKTNQFNLTAERYTEAQVRALAASPAGWVRAFRAADRFGDYGLIGMVICDESQPAVWRVQVFLLSCRALGRRVEDFMLSSLVAAAEARGVCRIEGLYRQTARNHLVREFYDTAGFTRIDDAGGQRSYERLLHAAAGA
jgi:FkbH-like protein